MQMVAISFTVFKDKIKAGIKQQTIRPYTTKRFHAILRKKQLQLYWKQRTPECEKLAEAQLKEIYRIYFHPKKRIIKYSFPNQRLLSLEEMDQLAIRDGFVDFEHMWAWFERKYKAKMFSQSFMVICW